jgi:hypothetical protein
VRILGEDLVLFRDKIASKFIEGFRPDEYAGWRIQHAVFGIKVLNRCLAARRIIGIVTLAGTLLS